MAAAFSFTCATVRKPGIGRVLWAARPQPGQRPLGHTAPLAGQDCAHRIPLVQPFGVGFAIFEVFHPIRAFLSAHVIYGRAGIGRIFVGQQSHRQWTAVESCQVIFFAQGQDGRVVVQNIELQLDGGAPGPLAKTSSRSGKSVLQP